MLSALHPLTPTINISTEREVTADTIKTVLEGFDPKLAGALTVAGASQHKKKKRLMYVWMMVQHWRGPSQPHVSELLCGKQKESLISFTLF